MESNMLIAASLAFALTALYQLFSLPAGIKAIVNEDLSRPLQLGIHVAGVLMYLGWMFYGFVLRDIAILFGCGMGAVSSGILLGYTFWLRKAK